MRKNKGPQIQPNKGTVRAQNLFFQANNFQEENSFRLIYLILVFLVIIPQFKPCFLPRNSHTCMRFLLTLQAPDSQASLPSSYRNDLAHTLHQLLWQPGGPVFKYLERRGTQKPATASLHFCFSPVKGLAFHEKEDRWHLADGQAPTLSFSSCLDQQALKLLREVLSGRLVEMGSGVPWAISEVDLGEEVDFSRPLVFQTLSPVCLPTENRTNGHSTFAFLQPGQAHFEQALNQWLLQRYHGWQGLLRRRDRWTYARGYWLSLEPQGEVTAQTLKLSPKPGKTEQVEAYRFQAKLHAPKSLLQMVYYGGMGHHTHLGLGFLEPVAEAGG
jgi:CRISPR-associated endoribonuclease Cas6